MPRPRRQAFAPRPLIRLALAAAVAMAAPAHAQQNEIAADPIAAEAFRCFGNEPFWQALVEGDGLRWSAPGAEGILVGTAVGRFDRAAWGDPPTAAWIGLLPPGLTEGQPADADATAQATALVIERRACADSMADTTHPLSAWLTHPVAGLVAGCCDPQVIAAPDGADDPPTWPGTAAALAPAIEACLAAAADHDRVIGADTREDGSIAVQLSNPRRERAVCAVDLAADGPPLVAEITPVRRDAPDPGPVTALVQTRDTAVVGACHRATPLPVADGTATEDAPLLLIRAVCTDPPVVGE